jgi:hypothetical protein
MTVWVKFNDGTEYCCEQVRLRPEKGIIECEGDGGAFGAILKTFPMKRVNSIS